MTQPTDTPKGFVYVIGPEDSRLVKIGRTIDPDGRLASIQRMSPVQLALLWTHPGDASHETALHREFRAYRQHGEWFDFGELDPIPLVAAAVEQFEAAEETARKRQAEMATRPGVLVHLGQRLLVMRADGEFRCVGMARTKRRCRSEIAEFDYYENRAIWSVPGIGVIEGVRIEPAGPEDEERILLQLCAAHYAQFQDERSDAVAMHLETPDAPITAAASPYWEPFNLADQLGMIIPRRYGQEACPPLPGLESVERKLSEFVDREARRHALSLFEPRLATALAALCGPGTTEAA